MTNKSFGLRRRKSVASSHVTASKASVPQPRLWDLSDFDCIVRSEVEAAIDESFARNSPFIKSRSDILQLLENEAQKMFDSVAAAKKRDEASKMHNKEMETRERVFRLIGLGCLMCPVLVIFNAIISLIPGDPVEVLEYAAQEESTYGAVSRLCLKTILMASKVSQANIRNGYIFLWGSVGAMALLLVLVRHTTVKFATMSPQQLMQMDCMERLIREELETRKASLRRLSGLGADEAQGASE